jgi:hypothetical protein
MTLSPREKNLAFAVGGTLFVVLNLFLFSAFSAKNQALRAELAQQRLEWSNMEILLGEQGLWADRDAALTAAQPKLTSENAAGVELLDSIRGIAKKHSVTLENEVLGGIVDNQWYRSAPVTLDTHSSWPDLVAFLYALQKPDLFIVCEAANVQQDPGDPTKMIGHFTIARWYAP